MEAMDDAALVVAARAGDERAFAELYRRHFDSVYDFAARLVRDREVGAEVAEAAFRAAMMAMPGLRATRSFRARLFAIARNRALSYPERTPTQSGSQTVGAGFDTVDPTRAASPGAVAAASAIAPLVADGALALDPRQLSLLDLQLRQGLGDDEIAVILDITRSNARLLMARACEAAEDRLAAFIMAARERDRCARLGAALAPIDTSTASPALRRVVRRHLSVCPACEGQRRRLASPLAVFAALQAIVPPAGAREQILEALMRRWPGAIAMHVRPEDDAAAGNVVPGRPPVRGRALLALSGLASATALVAVALLVPASPFAFTASGHDDAASPGANGLAPLPSATGTPVSDRTIATATRPASSVAPSASSDAGTPGAVTPGPSASSTATVTPSPGPTSTGTPPATATPMHTPASTPTSIPCVPRLATNGISQVFLAPGGIGSFFVYDAQLCGPLSFATSGPPWLAVAPATGSFATGGMAEVTIAAPAGDLAEGPHTGVVTVSGVPNGGEVSVTVTVTVVGSPPGVLSATCTASGATWTFRAQARDDFMVSSVALKYANDGGTVTVPMTGPDGSPAGEWTASITADPKAHAFTVTARDAAGQVATVTVPGCS